MGTEEQPHNIGGLLVKKVTRRSDQGNRWRLFAEKFNNRMSPFNDEGLLIISRALSLA
jgi:hypothetical protein